MRGMIKRGRIESSWFSNKLIHTTREKKSIKHNRQYINQAGKRRLIGESNMIVVMISDFKIMNESIKCAQLITIICDLIRTVILHEYMSI